MCNLLRIGAMIELVVHRGHRLGFNPARHDQMEIAEIGVDVQSEAVRGNSARDVNADGSDLRFSCRASLDVPILRFGPYPGETRDAVRRDPEIGAGTNQHVFQTSHELNGADRLSFSVSTG